MRPRILGSCLAIALLAGACSKDAPNPTNPTSQTTFVVPSQVTLGLGKHQRFQRILAGSGATWSLPAGARAGYISPSGVYYAPLRSPGVSTIKVVSSGMGSFASEATVNLTSDPAEPGDCLAEEQQGGEFGGYTFVEELPEALVKVSPIYPDPARQAGVDGLVMVQARVCACGEVDDTRVVKSIPMLDDAAVAAVRQWIFKPGLSNGEPVAVWVGVPVRFSLH